MRTEIAKVVHFHLGFFETTWFCHSMLISHLLWLMAANPVNGFISGLMYSLLSYGHFISVTLAITLSSSS